ncbi:methylaspartate mutase [Streptomyces sp. NBC_01217]|uniref:methylaspartate mutase n=1 Tax=Streptomyces sp. NBC_01217 TaxID=2903779 RepID=UPI002E1021F0|nr:methylaspartate mutase [Streptomyces sp. NBC_01217]
MPRGDTAPDRYTTPCRDDFGDFVEREHRAGRLVVQPRMGFAAPEAMRAGLLATRNAAATTVGTITLDSYTRTGDRAAADRALRDGADLNGYPLVNHSPATTRAVLDGIRDRDFPVQVRHGSAAPQHIFRALAKTGIAATEGGPVSYCLPYGRTPLEQSVRNWQEGCELALGLRQFGLEPHLETFGGCMLGQLCPPGMLVAMSVLEALFFHHHGIRSLSVSYAQQTNFDQDREAVLALRRLCAELLPDTRPHVVVYAYMGVYPATPEGAFALLGEAAGLAVATGAQRLIVKTEAEASRIPTVAENVAALEHAATVAGAPSAAPPPDPGGDSQTYAEAAALVEAVRNLHPDLGEALLVAFRRGYLDIPYCLHPDNSGRTRSAIDAAGRLRWTALGALPLAGLVETGPEQPALTSSGLLTALAHMRTRFDRPELDDPRHPRGGTGRGRLVSRDPVHVSSSCY